MVEKEEGQERGKKEEKAREGEGEEEKGREKGVVTRSIDVLSRESMKKAGMKNFKNDMVAVFGCNIKLLTSSSSHYCLPLTSFLLTHGI